jgi:hypothetical protein
MTHNELKCHPSHGHLPVSGVKVFSKVLLSKLF